MPPSVPVRSPGSGQSLEGAGRSVKRKRILIVEDHELNRDALQRRLASRGFDVCCAADGLQGLSIAEALLPDLILMDLGLPEIDGWECIRRLRANAATRRVPIIVLTAHALVGDRELALSVGCDEFDTKPIDSARLLLKIRQLLERT
jgi:two-component system cell cycle response regulator DivK